MDNFVSISEARNAKKGSFVGAVIKMSEPDERHGTTGTYEMQIVTLSDKSGTVDIAVFNEEMNFFELNCTYEVKPWWKDDGKVGIGKWGVVKKIDAPAIGKPTDDSHTAKIKELPAVDEALKEFTLKEHTVLSQITEIMMVEMAKGLPDNQEPRGDIMWVRVAEIYKNWNESKGLR